MLYVFLGLTFLFSIWVKDNYGYAKVQKFSKYVKYIKEKYSRLGKENA